MRDSYRQRGPRTERGQAQERAEAYRQILTQPGETTKKYDTRNSLDDNPESIYVTSRSFTQEKLPSSYQAENGLGDWTREVLLSPSQGRTDLGDLNREGDNENIGWTGLF